MLIGQLSFHDLCQASKWTGPVLSQVSRYVFIVSDWPGDPDSIVTQLDGTNRYLPKKGLSELFLELTRARVEGE